MAILIARPARPARPLQPRTGGFTLLEVMVAVAVIAIALVPLLRLHLLSLDATLHAQDLTIAVGLAQDKMSEMVLDWQLSDDRREAREDKGEFESAAYERFRWQASVGEIEEVVIPDLANPNGDPLLTLEIQRVEVTVIWIDGTREKLYTLASYVVL